MPPDSPPPSSYESPPWNKTTKVVVALIALLLLGALTLRFQTLIRQIIGAAMLAYILNPIVGLLHRRTLLSRGIALVIVYLVVAVGIVWALGALGVAAFQQITNFLDQVPKLIADVVQLIQEMTARTDPIEIGNFMIDPRIIPWDSLTDQVLGLAEPIVSRGGQFVRYLAATTVRWLGTMFFIFMISIYVAYEIPQMSGYISRFAQQPGYQQDAERLMRDFGRIWSAYLRGQVILGLVIFLVVWIGLTLLGVQNALALGLLGGLLEFVPTLGPLISAAVAVTVAFFQSQNYLGLDPWQFALAVLALMFLIQQLENTILVPRIVGEALDLHPLLVIVGVFMGGSLAGILGAVLAAPIVATIKLVGTYAWRKMFDLPPFPDPEPEPPPSRPTLKERARRFWQQRRWARPQQD